jgi:DNA-binding GntR family transcriptional regulator
LSSSEAAAIVDLPPRSLQRRSLHEEVVEILRELVLEGRIAPETRVPELELCRRLHVSRTPMREALKVLAAEGLVELQPNRGAVVTRIRVEETIEHFEVLIALEGAIGEFAAQRAADAEIAELERMHLELVREHDAGRRSRYFELNQAIHARLAATARNASLAATHKQYMHKIERARYAANFSQFRWDESLAEHAAIVDALKRRDGALLGETMRAHMRATERAVIAALRQVQSRDADAVA